MSEQIRKDPEVIVAPLSDGENMDYVPIPGLPVKAVTTLFLPRELDGWTHSVCGNVLRQWRDAGFVTMYGRATLIDVISQAYNNMPKERAEEIVANLVEKNLMREEGQLLVPENPLLRCATSHEIEPRTAWYCFTQMYSDVSISLEQ